MGVLQGPDTSISSSRLPVFLCFAYERGQTWRPCPLFLTCMQIKGQPPLTAFPLAQLGVLQDTRVGSAWVDVTKQGSVLAVRARLAREGLGGHLGFCSVGDAPKVRPRCTGPGRGFPWCSVSSVTSYCKMQAQTVADVSHVSPVLLIMAPRRDSAAWLQTVPSSPVLPPCFPSTCSSYSNML